MRMAEYNGEVADFSMVILPAVSCYLSFMFVMMMYRCYFMENTVTEMGLILDVNMGYYIMEEYQAPGQNQSKCLYFYKPVQLFLIVHSKIINKTSVSTWPSLFRWLTMWGGTMT